MTENTTPIPNAAPNWNLAETVKCEECGGTVFVQAVYLHKLSKLVAFTDKDMIRPTPTFACAKCGHVNKDFALRKSEDKAGS